MEDITWRDNEGGTAQLGGGDKDRVAKLKGCVELYYRREFGTS